MRKELALKVLRPDLSSLPDIAERFRREAEIAAGLEHDNIVRVTDFGRSPEGWLFLAMELLEGESLFERLRRTGPLMPEEAVSILVQMCRGLEAAHARGVVHRDLKPENIFLTAQPAGLVKILDFGIAKLTDPQIAQRYAGRHGGRHARVPLARAGDGDGHRRARRCLRGGPHRLARPGWPSSLPRRRRARTPHDAGDEASPFCARCTPGSGELAGPRGCHRACLRQGRARAPHQRRRAADSSSSLPSSLELLPVPLPSDSRSRTRAWTPPAPLTTAPTVEATLTIDARTALSTPLPVRLLRGVRGHRVLLGAVAAVALAVPASVALARWMEERPVARAQALLAANQPEHARDLLIPAVLRRPNDVRLRVLQGRALHRIPGQALAAMDAYAAALDLDPRGLDPGALADLGQDLGQEGRVAERSAKLLARVGPPAVPVVLKAVGETAGAARLRVLDLARELNAEDRIDRVGVYGALLSDPEGEVRRAAARRLGEVRRPGRRPEAGGAGAREAPYQGAVRQDAGSARVRGR